MYKIKLFVVFFSHLTLLEMKSEIKKEKKMSQYSLEILETV